MTSLVVLGPSVFAKGDVIMAPPLTLFELLAYVRTLLSLADEALCNKIRAEAALGLGHCASLSGSSTIPNLSEC